MSNATTKDIETVIVDRTPAAELVVRAQGALDTASAIVIDSPELYELAAEELRRIKQLQKVIEEKRTSITGPLNQALKATNAVFKAPAETLDQAETKIKRAMLAWQDVQRRLAEKAAQEAAQREAEERARLAAEAAEARRAAQEAAQAAAQAAEAQDEGKAVAAANEALQAEERAETLATTAAVTTVAPRFEAPKAAAGISTRKVYKAEVTDLAELVKAVAEGKAPMQCLVVNETFLRQQANAFKQEGQLYPGVVITSLNQLAARS